MGACFSTALEARQGLAFTFTSSAMALGLRGLALHNCTHVHQMEMDSVTLPEHTFDLQAHARPTCVYHRWSAL